MLKNKPSFLKLLFFTVLLCLTTWLNSAQNYDNAKVGDYELPEILACKHNRKVKTAKAWENIRRPEVVQLFEDNIYGKVPSYFDEINFIVQNEDSGALNGKAILKEVAIQVFRNKKLVTINLKLFSPQGQKKSVPVFLLINHRGLKTMDVSRQTRDDFWPVEQIIDAGYAIAGFDVQDIAPDDKIRFQNGVLDQLYPEQLNMGNGMGTLGAWAWGASRAIDYLENENCVDASKVILIGHSRGGKAALWCGAQDQRIALTIANESGNSGAALSRRNFGETVERIVTRYPYWFCQNYQQYKNNIQVLPIDQHMLIGLIAPRGVYISTAQEDLWSDTEGQYIALKESQSVFRLYGYDPKLPYKMPKVNQQFVSRKIGFHNREGKHDLNLFDWHCFIEFVDYFFN